MKNAAVRSSFYYSHFLQAFNGKKIKLKWRLQTIFHKTFKLGLFENDKRLL